VISLIFNSRLLSGQTNDTYFKVIHATSQDWSGGEAGSGSGTNFNFTIRSEKSVTISLDSLWTNNSFNSIYENLSHKSLQPISVILGDTLVISSEIYYPGEQDLIPGKIKRRSDIPDPCKECKSTAVIIFSVNGKVCFYEVGNIEELPAIAYP